MNYHIDTIPVWDALKSGAPCLMCRLREINEVKSVDFFLGASVMEPDIRIRVNRMGFCSRHQKMLYDKKNRLGHALLMLSHTEETSKRIGKLISRLQPRSSGLFSIGKKQPSSSPADELEAMLNDCIICSDIDERLASYAYTLLHMYKNDASFRKAFDDCSGLCLRDTAYLIRMAEKVSSSADCTAITSLLLSKLKKKAEYETESLARFTQKFDYRNADKPWGDSKEALERSVNLLCGKSIGES